MSNIYQKMLGVTSELSAVKKNLNVGVGKSSYKAVGEADVLAAVRPLEAKYGVYSYPACRKIIDSGTYTTKSSYNGNEVEKTQQYMRVETTYRFVNIEDPNDYIEITSYSDGIDTGDKAPGKAMTYGDKYALLKAYKIITGDDPDQNVSPEEGYKRKTIFPEFGAEKTCEVCGKAIEPYTDGEKTWPVDKVAAASMKRYGRVLCADCRRKEDEKK